MKSILVEADGGPLAAVLDGANRHDCMLLEATIESIVLELPEPEDVTQHLCLDKGYDFQLHGRLQVPEAGCSDCRSMHHTVTRGGKAANRIAIPPAKSIHESGKYRRSGPAKH